MLKNIFIYNNKTLLNYVINNKYFYKILAIAYLFAKKYLVKYNLSLIGTISLNLLCIGVIFRFYCLLYPISTTFSILGYIFIIINGLLRSWIIFCLTIYDLFYKKYITFQNFFCKLLKKNTQNITYNAPTDKN